MKTIQPHKLAAIFPPLTEEEQAALNEDVRAHGLKMPITLYEGKTLDGRHRDIACRETGTKPKYEQFKGTHAQAVAFVMSANLHRRHLTVSQRAAIAAQLATTAHGGDRTDQGANLRLETPPPLSRAEAAAKLNVSERSVDTAAKVIAEAPAKVVAQVKAGKITLNEAAEGLKPKLRPGPSKLKQKAAEIRCETGAVIPQPLHGLWDRRGEILDIMRTLAAVSVAIVKGHGNDDPLYASPGMQRAAESIVKAHSEIRRTKYGMGGGGPDCFDKCLRTAGYWL